MRRPALGFSWRLNPGYHKQKYLFKGVKWGIIERFGHSLLEHKSRSKGENAFLTSFAMVGFFSVPVAIFGKGYRMIHYPGVYRLSCKPFRFSSFILLMYFSLGFLLSSDIAWGGPSPKLSAELPSLSQAQSLQLNVVALTERGLQNPAELHDTLKSRLMEVGYGIVSDDTQPYDLVVRLKCEERKRWSGPSKYRVGTHTGVESSRLWKGPACQLSYRHPNFPSTWSREIHTPFEEAGPAAQKAGVKKAGLYALQQLNVVLQHDPFPLYLAAEWGQADRLVKVFHQTTTDETTQKLILELLGPLSNPSALSTLQASASNPALATTAISALGFQGEPAIPSLAAVVKNSKSEEQRLASIGALGEIATHNKTPSLFDQLVPLLEEDNPRIQTLTVRGLGKLGDQRAIPPLEALNLKTWTNTSTDPHIKELREALNWSLWQLNPDAHTGE